MLRSVAALWPGVAHARPSCIDHPRWKCTAYPTLCAIRSIRPALSWYCWVPCDFHFLVHFSIYIYGICHINMARVR